MKRQAIRRTPSQLAVIHQHRKYLRATTPKQRRREFIGGLLLSLIAVAAIVAAHWGPHVHG